ncbi:MAG TPA: aspartate aminotransferase family protein [Solirubrobacteraceae bacterium]|jgi:adenosylmethionine-8-amino-7-oxononanoate aminotransferase|nr:aspartate aminotransferase family protein [Solirubrobacteraceae bacterium]
MERVTGHEVVIERGEGVWVFDCEGRRYLDASAGLWYCNVGHGRGALADAAAAQMRQLASYQIFDVLANQPALDLADRLAEIAPTGEGSVAFLVSGGSDAVDTAAKIARRYWQAKGEPDRQLIVALEGAYHGMHGFGTSLAGIEANASGWGALVGGIVHVPRNDPGALDATLSEHAGRVAAFIGEPVQGAAGVYPPSDGYWTDVQDLCRQHDVLLIADEVICGFGRLGQWFGSQRFEITPDLVTTAKGLSSGYLPIGAVLAGSHVRDALWAAGPFRHGYTYSGHPAACAVALANLAVLEEERLIERVAALEPVLQERLVPLADHPGVAQVRVCGLLAGVELREEWRARMPAVETVMVEARRRGVLVRALVGQSLQISPPFVITEEQIGMLADVLQESLEHAFAGQAV